MLNEVLLDASLTLEQRGLYALIAAMAKGGKPVYLADLTERSGVSRMSLRGHLKALMARSLISMVRSETDRRLQLVVLVGSVEEHTKAVIAGITQRLERTRRRIRDEASKESIGEALMKEWLSLLITVDLFTDNARPGFLTNPLTGERLEYDRWYPTLKQAWEFHGPHHFQLTSQQGDPAELVKQQLNDLCKIGLSQRNGVTLIEVQAQDLRLDRMQSLIPPGTPLRSLADLGPVVTFLEQECARYRLSLGLRDR